VSPRLRPNINPSCMVVLPHIHRFLNVVQVAWADLRVSLVKVQNRGRALKSTMPRAKRQKFAESRGQSLAIPGA
jgi:hypothetical protein